MKKIHINLYVTVKHNMHINAVVILTLRNTSDRTLHSSISGSKMTRIKLSVLYAIFVILVKTKSLVLLFSTQDIFLFFTLTFGNT